MSKFCFKCGQELADQANFCTHCGQKQRLLAQATAVQPDQPDTQVNKSAEAQPLADANMIVQHKVALGYSDDATTFVYTATSQATPLASPQYILSFEPAGILLMGCQELAQFTDDTQFMPNDTVEQLDLEPAKTPADWAQLYLKVNGTTLTLLVPQPEHSSLTWQQRNFTKNLTYTM